MGIADKLGQWSDQVQTGVKKTSSSLMTWVLKVMTALVVAMTLTLIAQELFDFGSFIFVFLFVLQSALMIKIMSAWSMGAVLIFDLICALIALLLRMYLLIAP